MVGATSSNDTTRSEVGGVAGMGGDVRREWTPTPYHSPQPPSLLAAWIALLLVVISLLLVFAHEATSADPAPAIVGKALDPAYPPSWLAPLEEIRMPISALPKDPYALPQQNYQRSPIKQIARLTYFSSHGPIANPYLDAIWKPLNGGRMLDLQIPIVYGGLLQGEQIPAAWKGLLLIHRMSAPGSPTQTNVILPDIRTAAAKAWRDPETPVLNVIPIGPEGYAKSIAAKVIDTPAVIPEALTVCGWSYSSAPYAIHCANVAVAFRGRTYDAYKAQGKLCDAICESVYAGILKATGRQKIGQLYPRIEDCDAATHISIAAHAAAYANAMRVDVIPEISDFDRWFNQFGTGLDRASARAGWDAAKQSQ